MSYVQASEHKIPFKLNRNININAIPVSGSRLILMGLYNGIPDINQIQILRTMPIGGVFIYGPKKWTPSELRTQISYIKSLSKYPILWIGIDMEGGPVNHFKTKFPSAEEMGQFNNSSKVDRIAEQMSLMLTSSGINLNFAPVVDVHEANTTSFLKPRCFSSDPNQVKLLAEQMIHRFQWNGILPTAKHYPGHGATRIDSHKSLPVVQNDLHHYKEVHIAAFSSVFEDGVWGVMSGHLLIPSLDIKWPASLSTSIIQGLMKDAQHFKGLIVTDDLEMGALKKNFTIKTRTVNAILAGNHLLLTTGNGKIVMNMIEIINQELAISPKFNQKLQESVTQQLKSYQKTQIFPIVDFLPPLVLKTRSN